MSKQYNTVELSDEQQKIVDPTFDLDAAYQVLARMLLAFQSSD